MTGKEAPVGWAKRSVPTIEHPRGHAALCPTYIGHAVFLPDEMTEFGRNIFLVRSATMQQVVEHQRGELTWKTC
jgi:hypothetical protein